MNTRDNTFYRGRILNFLKFKNIEFSPEKHLLKNPENSKHVLRDIEETQPFPIGFIGPIEATFQWSTMILTAYDELSQEIVDSAMEQIEEKVEDEYFLMGPTFSVSDCVLASDLQEVQKKFSLSPLVESYIIRVNQQLQY